MPLTLYPFRFRDALTGKWVRARYLAEREQIAARYKDWEIIGQPEIRPGDVSGFNPHPKSSAIPSVHSMELSPTLDSDEAWLTRLFLRRYVTFCARRKQYARMEGAAVLLRNSRAHSQSAR